jgi:hypothetical protein
MTKEEFPKMFPQLGLSGTVDNYSVCSLPGQLGPDGPVRWLEAVDRRYPGDGKKGQAGPTG